MSTRARCGFVLDGKQYMSYCHSDGYPSYLGQNLVESLRGVNLDELRAKVRAMRLVKTEGKATAAACKKFGLKLESPVTWYWTLHDLQGKPVEQAMKGIMAICPEQFDIEWTYFIDLDSDMFIVQNAGGRVVGEYRLADLPKNLDTSLKALQVAW